MYRRLHIFNPETDYALASGSPYYTPPAHVLEIRKKNALLPALYASRGDAILMLDSFENPSCLDYYDMVERKGIKLMAFNDPEEGRFDFTEYEADPWGWNPRIRRMLMEGCPGLNGIISEEAVASIRALSHRRTTILIHEEMKGRINPEIRVPVEVTDPCIAVENFLKDRHLFFKAPWSSSGRGVMLADDLGLIHVEPWVRGVIRRQGSVMMEKAYDRLLDFATEWFIEDGKARFLGYSVFNVSRRGKYQSNMKAGQNELLRLITSMSKDWDNSYLDCQKVALEAVIGNSYSGPLGVDMLVTRNGNVNPCVEINLRHTMGMIWLAEFQ